MSVTSPVHETDPRQSAIPDTHGHAKGEHKPYAEERPIPYSARMLFLWFYHACRRGFPRYLMVADHMNSLTFEDPAAVHAVRRAIKHAEAGDLYGAAEIANVEVGHAAVVHEGITRRGMRYSIGAEVDNDPRSRPDAQNIVDAMKPDAMIRSIHFLTIPHPQTGAEYQWPFDNPEFASFYDTVGTERVWELYMEQLLDAIEKLPGQIIGHFFVPAKFGHWPDDATLETYEDRFIEACAEHGKAIELNTRFFYRYATDEESRLKFRSANLRLLRKAKARDVGIAVGSDAHSPKDQAQSFDEALSLLDEAEINELVFPIAGRLRVVALRATRDIPDEGLAALPAASSSHEAVPSAAEPVAETRVEEPAATARPSEATTPREDHAADDPTAPRPKRAMPKRPVGASSKRTTPGPAKGDASRGDARNVEASAAAPGDVTPAGESAAPLAPGDLHPIAIASADGPAHVEHDAEPANAHDVPEPAVPVEDAPPAARTSRARLTLPKPSVPADELAAPLVEVSPPVKSAAPEPVATKAEPVATKAEPVATKAEPVAKKAEPVAKKAEPVAKKAEPVAKKAAPVAKKAEPFTKKAEPPKVVKSRAKATSPGSGMKAPSRPPDAKTSVKKTPSPKAAPAKVAPAKSRAKAAPVKKAGPARKTAAKSSAKPAKAASAKRPVAAPAKGTASKPVAKKGLKKSVPASAKKSTAKRPASKAATPAARPPAKKKPAAKKKTTSKTRR